MQLQSKTSTGKYPQTSKMPSTIFFRQWEAKKFRSKVVIPNVVTLFFLLVFDNFYLMIGFHMILGLPWFLRQTCLHDFFVQPIMWRGFIYFSKFFTSFRFNGKRKRNHWRRPKWWIQILEDFFVGISSWILAKWSELLFDLYCKLERSCWLIDWFWNYSSVWF